MIEEIRIRDLGVISEAVLPLGAGFTAITGETGAGKTMVVTALGLLLGERAESATVRSGAEASWVEGRWYLAGAAGSQGASGVGLIADAAETAHSIEGILSEAGTELEQGELLVARTVSAEGRSRANVCGKSTPVSVLSDLGEQLVAVHGQSDQVRLRSAVAQRAALDRFAGSVFAEVLSRYQHAFRQWKANVAELEELTAARDARTREADDLRQAMSEIEAVAPQPGEDVQLAELAERLTHTEELRMATAGAHEALSSEGDDTDVLGLIESARRSLDKVAHVDPVIAGLAESLAQLSFQASDAAGQLSSHLANLEGEGERDLDLIQQRRAELTTLMRRYGPTLDDVIATLQNGSARLLELDGDSERIDELARDVEREYKIVAELARELHGLREKAAIDLSAQVTHELAALAMPDAQLHVVVTALDDLGLTGGDAVELLLKPHSGAEPRPIAKGASGGELSRVMLALEVVIAGKDSVPTYVFDEVDAGVGGAAAIEIGRRLAKLAESAQVIVVTHLAQVAAFANNHLRVLKDTSGEVTVSSVQSLSGADREAEMARLLSGLPDSQSGLEHARELLALAAS